MPEIKVAPDLDMHYRVDDFTDPWRKPATVLLLHGFSESSEAWFAMVPGLARHLRVVRPDMRGFGRSTPMPIDYVWSVDTVIDDFVSLMRKLDVERFHLVGGKVGGTIAMRFAARYPDEVLSLTTLGSPFTGSGNVAARIPGWLAHIEQHGVESWARWTMPGRLGEDFPAAGAEWWAQMMGRTPLSTHLGFVKNVPGVDAIPDLPRIRCPALIVTTTGSNIGTVEEVRELQQRIPRSRLLVLEGSSYHVAASHGERCAAEIVSFIQSGSTN